LIQSFRFGVAEYETTEWEWGLAPEVGVMIPIRVGSAFVINARYHWSPTPENIVDQDIELSYVSLSFGFAWEQ
jgi:hypothetical protein